MNSNLQSSDWSRLSLKLGMACKEVDTNVEEEEKEQSLKLKRNGKKEKRRRLCSDEDENSNPEDSRFEMCDREALGYSNRYYCYSISSHS